VLFFGDELFFQMLFFGVLFGVSSGVLRKMTCFCEENWDITRRTPEETVFFDCFYTDIIVPNKLASKNKKGRQWRPFQK